MAQMYYSLINRRAGEANIAYAESHDQALVGDKTIAFWLMDKEMYTGMSVFTPSDIVDRGIALHKLIRFITLTLGGEGYLNFMGNEFGHPEWIDFPREGNNWSAHYARRQWDLPDTDHLKYKYLQAFDEKMINFSHDVKLHGLPAPQLLNTDDYNKVIIFSRGEYVFIFSFSPRDSVQGYEFYVPKKGDYKIVFSSDEKEEGGFSRVKMGYKFSSYKKGKNNFLKVYLPTRMCMVLKRTPVSRGKKK
jgi:1,4-alpha-glucan branching enzyme